jgi:hypothetical protein
MGLCHEALGVRGEREYGFLSLTLFPYFTSAPTWADLTKFIYFVHERRLQ